MFSNFKIHAIVDSFRYVESNIQFPENEDIIDVDTPICVDAGLQVISNDFNFTLTPQADFVGSPLRYFVNRPTEET